MLDGPGFEAAMRLLAVLLQWGLSDRSGQRVPLSVYKAWATLGFTSDDTFTSGTGLVEGVRLAFVTEASTSPDAPPFVVVRSPNHRDVAVAFDGDVLSRGSTDPATGDPAFDAVVRIASGELPRAFALLDPPTREAVRAAVQAGARFTGTRWEARFAATEALAPNLPALLRVIGRAHRQVASRITGWAEGPPGPIEAVLERLYEDRVASVRRRALRVLMAQNGVTVERLQPCLGDIDPEVRTTAAERVGAWPVLLELARTGSRSWRVRSASTLARVGAVTDLADRALVREVLVRALDDAEHACAAVEGLAALGGPDVLPPLTEAARSGPVAARAVAQRVVDRLQWQYADTAGGLILHGEHSSVGGVALAGPAEGGLSDRGAEDV